MLAELVLPSVAGFAALAPVKDEIFQLVERELPRYVVIQPQQLQKVFAGAPTGVQLGRTVPGKLEGFAAVSGVAGRRAGLAAGGWAESVTRGVGSRAREVCALRRGVGRRDVGVRVMGWADGRLSVGARCSGVLTADR